MNKTIAIICSTLLTLIGCFDMADNSRRTNPFDPLSTDLVVHTVGNNNGYNCYWIGTNEVWRAASSGGKAWGIFRYNNVIYLSGRDSGNNAFYQYGLSMTKIQLATGGMSSIANELFIENGIVYTAGKDGAGNACYWTGTTLTSIGVNTAAALYVKNGTVYTAGRDATAACYWINAARTTVNVASSIANAVFFTNGVVYTAGSNENNTACIWAGTSVSWVSAGPLSVVNSMVFKGTTVYLGGQENNKPCVWIGSLSAMTKVDLETATGGYVNKITIHNGTIYAAGTDSLYHACYWTVNESTHAITKTMLGPLLGGEARGIFVAP